MFPQKQTYSIEELQNQYNEQTDNRPKINDEIKSFKIQLIDETGTNYGVVSIKDALFKSRNVGLDLVEINPKHIPPICKIMNVGKYMYERNKALRHNKQHKGPETRELRLSPTICDHDLEIKAKKAKEFILEGSKVIINFKCSGREAKKIDVIKETIHRFENMTKSFSRLENKGEVYILIPSC